MKSGEEERLVNDKKLEEDYKLNSEATLEIVDATVNVVEKEDSATNLQKEAASEEFHNELTNQRNYCESSETPEKVRHSHTTKKVFFRVLKFAASCSAKILGIVCSMKSRARKMK